MQDPSFTRLCKRPILVLPGISIKPLQKLEPIRLNNSSFKKDIGETLENEEQLKYEKEI